MPSLVDSDLKSLATRVKEEMNLFDRTGLRLHNKALFEELHGLLGYAHLVVAHEVNL